MAQQRLLRHETLADYVPKVYTTQYLCLPQYRHPRVRNRQWTVSETVPDCCLSESSRPKAGNRGKAKVHRLEILASMKVPARRRGNTSARTGRSQLPGLNESPRPKAGKSHRQWRLRSRSTCLNESPRPKAEKFIDNAATDVRLRASMKIPAQRWRNKTIKPIKVAALMPQ